MKEAFSHNPLMIGYDNNIFDEDYELGFKFPEGRLIKSPQFIDLKQAVDGIKIGFPTILNMGDSSTSGWDSNLTFQGNQDPLAPFFSYKTYSRLLREQVFANVLNAGVPGYTSYQGQRYLEILMKKIYNKGKEVDFVTIYFGNNDQAYNLDEDKVLLDHKLPSPTHQGERVTVEDFARNLESMIGLTREYGAEPILIVPLVNYFWEPGIRSSRYKNESLEILEKIKETELGCKIERARRLYERRNYKQAVEEDPFLPRLKKRYRKAILKVVKRTRTPFINVQRQIDSILDFADYCHPLESINQMIVDELIKIWNVHIFKKRERKKVLGEVPPNIYTFH